MSTTVLALFTTSEAYRADLNIINDGMSLISSCEGVLENYHGIDMENNNVGFTIQTATSADAFKAVVTNQELFDSIMTKMEVSRIGGIEQYHTNPISDPRKALSGPVTEACVLTLKNPTPENREAFETLAKEFEKLTEGKWTYGWSGEDSNKAIVVAAWDSVEAHHARVLEADVADSFKEFMTLVDTNRGPFHARLLNV